MNDAFFFTLQAILPILLVIFSGCAMRRLGRWDDDFYRQLNALCFRFFLPIQLFCNVCSIESLAVMNWRMMGYILLSIFGCLLLGLLASVYTALNNLAKVASPVMLFVLGVQFDIGAVRELLPQLTVGVLMRLVVCPPVVIGLALALREPLGLTAVELPSLAAASATPVAVSSAVMAQEMGGDSQLASQLVIWSSLLSVATVFGIVYLLRFWGFL